MAMMLINGELREKPVSTDGKLIRFNSDIRHWIEPHEGAEFPVEAGRYHLYTSHACPWCHRAMVMRALTGLESAISITEMHPFMGEKGWQIDQSLFDEAAGVPRDEFIFEVYLRALPRYTGPLTVPLLVDKKTGKIVSNNSADIMRMLNTSFGALASSPVNYHPDELSHEIDEISGLIQNTVNSGVYKAGFATSQAAYTEAVSELFDTLDKLDNLLGYQRYLVGHQITEADWRLFATLIRFDAVYVTHFKTDLRRIADYTNLGPYLRELYQIPGIAETVNFKRMREHYFRSHLQINPNGIIPIGPELDLTKPHGRDHIGIIQKGAA
ncbi:glutathione-dependent reductase [Pseudovibrio japonicus]|uniref:Glutathione-dependent reductase n=1 Tax=Pseudovibrio japonicus TaxID=366534 RepID=A0ABQ3ENT6_9HYPH|nr:glutathione S-transferase C-terminal domain-containing protein [Pseudovibrio japonicus]GHB43577.1 glutathione-dependent reductase [Pseudovibrio japonicus]